MITNLDYRLNVVSTLDDALLVSHKVFSPSEKEVLKYHDKNDWLNKIRNKGLLISVYDDIKCVAFAICYKKEKDQLHIWSVGVLDTYRGRGIWKQIYKNIIQYAQEKGFQKLSLNTYKDEFPNMYTFVKKEGFKLLSEEKNPDGSIKSRFVKNIM